MYKPFSAYEGDQPYLFVSYAHEDEAIVYPEMAWLNDAGFNLWYDDGIHVGAVWRQALADALIGSSGLVFFSTAESMKSSNCLKEINFALDEDKPVFVVQLDDTPLPSLLRLALSDRQALLRSALDEDGYKSRLTSALATVVPQRHLIAARDTTSVKKTPTDITGIAIVPFRALRNDETLGHFAECVTSSMANRFHQRFWRTVEVMTEDRSLPPEEIGARYGVHYAITGTIRGGKDRFRGTFKLMSTQSGDVVWSRDIEAEAADLLAAEDDFVFFVDEYISRQLLAHEKDRLAHVSDEDLDAFGLAARACMLTRGPPSDTGLREGDLLRIALRKDPELLFAHAIYANHLAGKLVWLISDDPEQDAKLALQHAESALDYGSADLLYLCAEVHGLLGNIERNWFLARSAHNRLNKPQELYFCTAQMRNGNFKDVIETSKMGKSMMIHTAYLSLLADGQLDEALEWAKLGGAGFPKGRLIWASLAAIHGRIGDRKSAEECLSRERQNYPDFSIKQFERHQRQFWHNEAIVDALMRGFREIGLV